MTSQELDLSERLDRLEVKLDYLISLLQEPELTLSESKDILLQHLKKNCEYENKDQASHITRSMYDDKDLDEVLNFNFNACHCDLDLDQGLVRFLLCDECKNFKSQIWEHLEMGTLNELARLVSEQ